MLLFRIEWMSEIIVVFKVVINIELNDISFWVVKVMPGHLKRSKGWAKKKA